MADANQRQANVNYYQIGGDIGPIGGQMGHIRITEAVNQNRNAQAPTNRVF